MSLYDRLLQGLKQVKPKVKNTPIERNQFVEQFTKQPTFHSHKNGDFKVIAFELWKILEDIEKAEVLTPNDTTAYRSIVKELSEKRYVYLKENEVTTLQNDVQAIIKEENKE